MLAPPPAPNSSAIVRTIRARWSSRSRPCRAVPRPARSRTRGREALPGRSVRGDPAATSQLLKLKVTGDALELRVGCGESEGRVEEGKQIRSIVVTTGCELPGHHRGGVLHVNEHLEERNARHPPHALGHRRWALVGLSEPLRSLDPELGPEERDAVVVVGDHHVAGLVALGRRRGPSSRRCCCTRAPVIGSTSERSS